MTAGLARFPACWPLPVLALLVRFPARWAATGAVWRLVFASTPTGCPVVPAFPWVG